MTTALLKFVFVSVAFVSIAAAQPPASLSGLTRVEIPEVKGVLLKPEKWFFRRIAVDGGVGYQITKELVTAEKDFRTGLTIKCREMPTEKKASAIAEKLFQSIKAKGEVQGLIMGTTKSGYRTIFFEQVRPSEVTQGENEHCVHRILASDDDHLLIYISFVSPADSWRDDSTVAETMLTSLLLFTEIKKPNQALVPTVTSVTPAADAPVAPAAPAAHL